MACALLAGCADGGLGIDPRQDVESNNTLTADEWEEFVDWCNDNYTPSFGSMGCGPFADLLTNNLNLGQWKKACLIHFYKQFAARGSLKLWGLTDHADQVKKQWDDGHKECGTGS